MTVYRVICKGTHIQPLEIIRSSGNGWHRYKVLDPDPMAGEVIRTRQWYAHPTPMGAVLQELAYCASRMRIAAVCLADPGTHPALALKIKGEVNAEMSLHNALLAQAAMIAGDGGLMRSKESKR